MSKYFGNELLPVFDGLSVEETKDLIRQLEQKIGIGKNTREPAGSISGNSLTGNMLAAGAIVEYGENSNGQYWRWESGLQVCYSIKPDPVKVDTRSGSVYVYNTPIIFVHPAEFMGNIISSDASPFVHGYPAGDSRGWGTINSTTNIQTVTVIYGHIHDSAMFPGYIAIGRWK